MTKYLLIWLAALCSFVAARLNYYDGGRSWIVGLQVLGGLLMAVSAFTLRSRS